MDCTHIPRASDKLELLPSESSELDFIYMSDPGLKHSVDLKSLPDHLRDEKACRKKLCTLTEYVLTDLFR